MHKIKRLFKLYLATILLAGSYHAIQNESSLSAVAAQYIDEVLPHKKLKFEERMTRGFKARCMSLLVYPAYALADAAWFTPKAAWEYACSQSCPEPHATELAQQAREDFTLAKRSLVGFASFPAGLISADYVTRHFVQKQSDDGIIRSGGLYYATEGRELQLQTVKQVQNLVAYAKNNDRRISIKGSGLSQGMQYLPIDNGDLVLDMTGLNDVSILPEEKIAIAQAGATWREVQTACNPHRLSIQVMQASNIFTVGGSLSANCHGWDHHAGTLSNTIRALTIVNANGELQRVERGEPLFGLIAGGYGLHGIIVEAEIELTDNHALIDYGEEVAINDYVRYFYEDLLPQKDVEMHLYRLSLDPRALLSEGVAQNYRRDPKRPGTLVSDLTDEAEMGRRIERVGVHTARKFQTFRKEYWKQEKQTIIRPRETSRNDEMRAPIQAMLNHSQHDSEWLQEFFLPGEELAPFLAELGPLLTDYKVCLINASVRYVKQDTHALMGYARDGDRFAVVLCFNQPLDPREIDHSKEWIRRAIDLTLKHGGSYYLPYQQFASKEQFQSSYPHFDAFMLAKAEQDPDEIFNSQFYEHHKELVAAKQPADEGSIRRDALSAFRLVLGDQDSRREYRKFFRNIFLNLDEDAFIALADEALITAGDNQQLYQTLEDRLSEAEFSTPKSLWRSLRALRQQKKALRQQVETLMGSDTPIDGYVEIGFPGRMIRPVAKVLDLTGPVYVVNTEEGLADYLQSGFPRPYDSFIPLGNYNPLTDSMESGSVDLVSAFIGLHHCPVDQLDAFVQSIADVLRSGGSFLLRDHDAHNAQLHAQATLAHTSFNLGTGVPWDGIGDGMDESTEIRNFQGLDYWDALMEKHGLMRDKDVSPLLRPGDPTNNALVRYVKRPTGIALAEVELDNPESKRPQMQTFMTSIEWHSVRNARSYADYIEHTPFYMYPYFSEIQSFWQTFALSWKEARKYHSAWEIISSDYFLMNLFIALFHSMEFFLKGLISAPIAWMYQSEANLEPDTISMVVWDKNDQLKAYDSVRILRSAEADFSVHEVELPRYMKFRDLVLDMTDKGIQLLNVAGQKRIQLQCSVDTAQTELCEGISGSRLIGKVVIPATPERSIVYLNAEVPKLHRILKELRQRGVSIDYIHDF